MLWETDTIILPYAAKILASYTQYEEKYLTPLPSLPQTAGPIAGPWARLAQVLTSRAMTTSSSGLPSTVLSKMSSKNSKSGRSQVVFFFKTDQSFCCYNWFPSVKKGHFVLEDVLSVTSLGTPCPHINCSIS